MSRAATLFTTLIRTHHITSRKKLARVKKAAAQLDIDFLLIRSGGSPGIMFAASRDEAGLNEWVNTVQALRYKDFRCVRRPAAAPAEEEGHGRGCAEEKTGVEETGSVSVFGEEMRRRGLEGWWRKGMGYEGE